jgi:serine/threonine protein kinase
MSLQIGSRLGPYEILAPIGAGGMGEVYKARDTRLDRTVAIKVLREESTDADSRQRFQHEARAVAALNHPHICTLFDVGRKDGIDYLVMEHLEGVTLAERLSRGPLLLADALRHAIEIADALDRAHRAGIVHRDLKPGNVMLTPGGVKLLDFGLAKLRRPETPIADHSAARTLTQPLTERGALLGTLPYMAPEQLEGKDADPRTDLFAFGVVLYEMLTGRKAFAGRTQAEVAGEILHVEPPALPATEGVTHERLEHILQRSLAKNPEERWQSARDLLLELRWAAKSPDRTEARSSSPLTAHRRRLVPLRWALAAVLLLALAAVVPWFRSGWAAGSAPAPLPDPPVIILMDSLLADRVYDPRTLASGGTNADDITDALRDLEVQLHKETTSPAWHREEQVLKQRPRLVVAHLSCLRDDHGTQEGSSIHDLLRDEAWDRLRTLMAYWGTAEPRTGFLLYSRGFPTESERRQFVADLVQRFPVLRNRVRIMHVAGDERASFRDPATAAALKEQVVAMLREE